MRPVGYKNSKDSFLVREIKFMIRLRESQIKKTEAKLKAYKNELIECKEALIIATKKDKK